MSRANFISVGGNAQIETPAGKTLVLGNPVYDDLRVEMSSVRVPATGGPGFSQFKDNGSGSTGVFLYWFDASSVEQVYFCAQFPHGQMQNSGVSPHIHWTPAANGTAGHVVSWGLEYTWSDIGGAFGNTSIIYTNTRFPNDASLVAGKHYLSDFADIKVGMEISNVLICRLFRDATGAGLTDSYTGDAGAIYFDFHYKLNTLGSTSEYSR